MRPFEHLLHTSAAAHGHLCPGQVVGVRMAVLGCGLIGLEDPRRDVKQLLVWVEMDRCAADAVSHVTGVSLGRRSLKFVDYGIMAATFLNLATGAAFRVVSTEESRGLAERYAPEETARVRRQLVGYRRMPDADLFRVYEVEVPLRAIDLPGPTRRRVACSRCGQVVRDGREVLRAGEALCRPCAGGAYFTRAREVVLEDPCTRWPVSPLAR